MHAPLDATTDAPTRLWGVMSELPRLVQATVRPQRRPQSMTKSALEVAAFSGVGPLAARVLAHAGVGLELQAGEMPLAAISSYDEQRGFEHRMGAVITNVRTIMGGWSSIKGNLNDVRGAVFHDEVTGLDAKMGLLGSQFDLHTPRGPQKWVGLFGHFPEIEGFFRGLLTLPFGQRNGELAAMPSASATDPTGAEAAVAGLWLDDPRTAESLRAISALAAHRQITFDHAMDFVGRITLAHRAAAAGPAATGTTFVSPMSADDLGNVLVGALGGAVGYGNPAPGTHALDFRYDPQRDTLSPALQALGIASFLGLGVGFSPGRMIAAEMMRKPRLDIIRFVYADVPGGCAYEIHGNGRRLELLEGELAHGLHQLLVHSALPVLARRIHHGWHVPYASLFAA